MKNNWNENEIEAKAIQWLWANDWWDGILAGMCEYNGQKYYAQCFDENDNEKTDWYRKFKLINLPEDVLKKEIEKHNFFVEKVGDHFEFQDNKRKNTPLKPQHLHKEFYEKYPPRPDNYEQYPVVGWFKD